jgi:hypothetical protein
MQEKMRISRFFGDEEEEEEEEEVEQEMEVDDEVDDNHELYLSDADEEVED